jgi:hypothetical protein
LEVNGASPGLIVGSFGEGDDERGLYVSEVDGFTSIRSVPTVEESASQGAAGLEALLRIEHERTLRRGEPSPLARYLGAGAT